MGVESPGELTVTCDKCECTLEMDVTEYTGDPPSWGVDSTTIAENGWIQKDGEIICGDCNQTLEFMGE